MAKKLKRETFTTPRFVTIEINLLDLQLLVAFVQRHDKELTLNHILHKISSEVWRNNEVVV